MGTNGNGNGNGMKNFQHVWYMMFCIYINILLVCKRYNSGNRWTPK